MWKTVQERTTVTYFFCSVFRQESTESGRMAVRCWRKIQCWLIILRNTWDSAHRQFKEEIWQCYRCIWSHLEQGSSLSRFIHLINILNPILPTDPFLFVCNNTGLKLSCRCFSDTSTLWQLQIQDQTPFLSHAFLGQAGIIVIIQLFSLLSHVNFPVVGVLRNLHSIFSPWWTVCSQLHGMSTFRCSHIPPFQSLLDLVLMLGSTHNIF